VYTVSYRLAITLRNRLERSLTEVAVEYYAQSFASQKEACGQSPYLRDVRREPKDHGWNVYDVEGRNKLRVNENGGDGGRHNQYPESRLACVGSVLQLMEDEPGDQRPLVDNI
jgi:hypothetical protein